MRDVIEPQRGKKARIAKEYELGLYIGRRSVKPKKKETISSLDVELWQEAINDEMDFLDSNET